jgi:hypothetical protein
MAAGDAIEVGTAMKYGFGSFAVTNPTYVYIEESLDISQEADVTVIKDENGATVQKLVQDRAKIYRVALILDNTNSTLIPPIPGTIITLTTVDNASAQKFMVQSSSAPFSSGATRWNLELEQKEAMTY